MHQILAAQKRYFLGDIFQENARFAPQVFAYILTT
jgi:hypothetical protein